ncbi:MAG: hypothetical protein JWR83_2098, partial [Aeromicrobium sp.]|nr:hypothetical protein [Aeromicrobium sp.]
MNPVHPRFYEEFEKTLTTFKDLGVMPEIA